jgi:hypothetical protein
MERFQLKARMENQFVLLLGYNALGTKQIVDLVKRNNKLQR